jgi:hypothetical protein
MLLKQRQAGGGMLNEVALEAHLPHVEEFVRRESPGSLRQSQFASVCVQEIAFELSSQSVGSAVV